MELRRVVLRSLLCFDESSNRLNPAPQLHRSITTVLPMSAAATEWSWASWTGATNSSSSRMVQRQRGTGSRLGFCLATLLVDAGVWRRTKALPELAREPELSP